MDPTPEQVVFGITELADKIFSFVDTKSLCKARQVCHSWRKVSSLSLKRRLKLSSNSFENAVTFSGHEIGRLSISENPPRSLMIKDAMEPKPLDFRKITTCTALLITVIEQDWIGFVSSLTLRRCLTVHEWNAVGCRILKKFSGLGYLDVEMTSSSTAAVLPLHYEDMRNDEDNLASGFKFQFLENVHVTLYVTDRDDPGEPTRACLDLLDYCPELATVSVMWRLENLRGIIGIDASTIYNEHSENFNFFGCQIFEDGMSSMISNTCAQGILKDLAKVLTFSEPRELDVSLPFHPDLVSSIPSSAEIHTVTVDLEAFDPYDDESDWVSWSDRRGGQQQQQAEDLLLPFFSTTAFASAQKLIVKADQFTWRNLPQHSRIMTIPFPKVTVVEFSRTWGEHFVECEGMLPDSADLWMMNELWPLAPNAELLVVNFGVIRSRLTALRMAKNFPSLKHLVLVIVRPPENNLEVDAADLDVTEIQCLQGLQGVTVIARSSVEDYIPVFVKACGSISTIRKLSVHCANPLDQEVDLTTLGIAIPENLIVESRSIYGDSGKAVLEGVQNTMMTWQHLVDF